jgi:hypothetical protein
MGVTLTDDQSEKQLFFCSTAADKIGDVIFVDVLRAPGVFTETSAKEMVVS